MGSGSSKNRQPIVVNPVESSMNPVESSMNPVRSNYESFANDATVYAAFNNQPLPAQAQAQGQGQAQAQSPIGRTNIGLGSSADNSIYFVVLPNVAKIENAIEFDDSEYTEEVPATQFNFFFIRHAKSCANEEVYFNKHIKKFNLSDPFISNDGIFATTSKSDEYKQFFDKRRIDNYFCSPLGRTWFTIGTLLPDKSSKFQIAPHLREHEFGPTNNPYPYETNVKRFEFFKKYAKNLVGVEMEGPPGYALMNKAFGAYGSDFIDEIGIAKFIEWYIKNENILGRNNRRVRNVVVVCHSDLIKTFCNNHLSREQLIARGMEQQGNSDKDWFFKKTHNYCVQVQVEMKVPQEHERNIQPVLAPLAPLAPAPAATESILPGATMGTSMIPSAGGKKHMKTKRRKSIKLNNKLNNNFKKSRIRKQRGGNRPTPVRPFRMAIFIAIEGTRDYKRDESKKQDDCICNPDAYMDQDTAIKCAKEKGAQELADFKSRQVYKGRKITTLLDKI